MKFRELLILTLTLPLFSPWNAYSMANNPSYRIEKVATLEAILWGFDFFPDGERMIITEREGRMLIYNKRTKKTSVIAGVPDSDQVGQGGLLDVKLHPNFTKNRWLYFSYSKRYDGGVGTIIARGKLNGTNLTGVETLFKSSPPGDGGRHFGSRIVFKDGYIFFGVGDRGNRDIVQSLNNPNGKVFRIKEDGSIPADNPFANVKDAVPGIWSYGHRNPQGMDIHPETGEIWEQEHGPRGGDEINLIKKGLNYGWPKTTYGKEYWGPSIGPNKLAGTEPPVKYYVPSIAPSSLMIYSGKMFPEWKNRFFNAALKAQVINVVKIENGKAGNEMNLVGDLNERIRHIEEAPNGAIYFSTDSGNIYRITK